MGLLTNPKSRAKLSEILKKHGNQICFLSFVAGIGYFLALGHGDLNAKTYFSENALLPGLVEPEFYYESDASKFYQSLKEFKKKDKDNLHIPVDWLLQQFTALGIEAYVQDFNFTIPMGLAGSHSHSGRNVYGIVRAPRASSTESVVLTAPYRPPGSSLGRTGAGIGLMLALAKLARSKTYWAKDLIFLVTENEFIGLQAWLDAFHDTRTSKYIYGSELAARSGPIQAALNIELGREKPSYINLKLEGVNGKLPNLDLVNTAVRLCKRERITPTLHHRADYWNEQSAEGAAHGLLTLSHMLLQQASGQAAANHGLFLNYQIEALTLESGFIKGSRSQIALNNVGRVVEGILRSLNNLQERFHQSFFFYLLPSTERYVSIGLYMQPFALVALPVVVKLLMLWMTIVADPSANQTKESDGDADQARAVIVDWSSLLATCCGAALLGLLALRAPELAEEASRASLLLQPADALLYLLFAISLCGILMPFILRSRLDLARLDWRVLKFVLLTGEGVLLGMLALLNFSLALLLTVAAVPLSVTVRPSPRISLRLLLLLLLFLTSPLSLLLIASGGRCLLQDPRLQNQPEQLFKCATSTLQSGVSRAAINYVMVGEWAWTYVTLAVFPLWIIKAVLIMMPVKG